MRVVLYGVSGAGHGLYGGARVQEAVFSLAPDDVRRALVHHAPEALVICATCSSW